jgi:ornithine decarboxylase
MAISDEELSCISGDEFKYNIMNQAKSKCESSCESEAYGRDSDTSSDSGSVEVEELPFVINEIITKYGLEYVKNSLLSEISDYVKAKITTEHLEEAFYVVDLGPVFRRWGTWMRLMPRVKPHYAVKCNPSPVILALLAALGTGFDCASSRELDLVASLGVDVSKRVIFANPCKLPGHIRYARQLGCNLSTFDTESELHKIKELFPESNLVLRIRADDPNARCQLGNKFGAESEDVAGLLQLAKNLSLTVVGISFHVGSGATDPLAFKEAIKSARVAWDEGLKLGFEFNLLDIGGGFCGEQDMDGLALAPVADAVNAALNEHFPPTMDCHIIAEPGRYFAEACATLVTNVYGRRQRKTVVDGESKVEMDYWISDGLYGSMNCLVYDHAVLSPKPLYMVPNANQNTYSSTLFGPTCDGLDCVVRDVDLPLMHNGDWVLFPCMGAYTMAAGSDFNGFNITQMKRYYVWSLDSGVDVDLGPGPDPGAGK